MRAEGEWPGDEMAGSDFGGSNPSMTGGEGIEWWRDMTEAQKDFWYAARERDTAEAISRRLRASKYFLGISTYMLLTLWVWVLRDETLREWWGSYMTLGLLTVGFIRGFWLYFVTYLSDRHDSFALNRGVGNEYSGSGSELVDGENYRG